MTGAAWFGVALALLVAFLIRRVNGTQAARLARMDRAAAEERAELWRVQAIKGAEAIGEIDAQIRAVRLCRDQAEAERDELRGQLTQAQAQAVELRARLALAWCAEDEAEARAQAHAEPDDSDSDDGPIVFNPGDENNGAAIEGAEASAPSAVHGPEGLQCDDHQKKTVLQDGQGGACE